MFILFERQNINRARCERKAALKYQKIKAISHISFQCLDHLRF